MKVVTFETMDRRTRYYLADDSKIPVKPVLDYLRFEDNRGLARNTLRLHCIQLKHFYTFMKQKEIEYTEVIVDHLAELISWLKYPTLPEKVVPLMLEPAVKAQTINAIVDTVLGFYNYLLLHDEFENQLSQKLVKFVKNPVKNYRSFLNGISDEKHEKRYMLHLTVAQSNVKTIAKEDVNALMKAANNIRDYFLLYLLYETGMRIGEALSLWLEDFDISDCKISIHDRGEMENLSEIKTVSSPRKLDCTQDLMEVFTEYVCSFHTEGVKTNHVFIKMMGNNAGKAMNYISGYWNTNDLLDLERPVFRKEGIDRGKHREGILADFSDYKSIQLKAKIKFYLLHGFKNQTISVSNIYGHYRKLIKLIGKVQSVESFKGADIIESDELGDEASKLYIGLQRSVIRFITDFYDERPKLERDKWHALLIPGVKLSAAIKSQKPSLSFEWMVYYYKDSANGYMKTLIYKRSWSFCTELLVYIPYFYKSFYEYGYWDGFQENLSQKDVEAYLGWVAEDYEHNNATFRSKAVSFIRNWLDFIQLAEFDVDIPVRERATDTFEKIKYIPEPARSELDAAIEEIEPVEMKLEIFITLKLIPFAIQELWSIPNREAPRNYSADIEAL